MIYPGARHSDSKKEIKVPVNIRIKHKDVADKTANELSDILEFDTTRLLYINYYLDI